MRRNITVEAVLAELRALGIDFRLVPTRKHQAVYWTAGGPPRMYVCPSTPSDRIRGPHNARADVRRILRADGAIAR